MIPPTVLAIQIGELCRRLDVPYRVVRYVLEEGCIPEGADLAPERGNHRLLSGGQAFWLAVLVKLKQCGFRTAVAKQIADRAQEHLRGIAQNLSYDPGFHPFRGRFQTDHQWFVEVGDAKYVRVLTSCNPSGGGQLEAYPWQRIGERKTVEVDPVVIVGLNVARLAEMLAN